MNDNDINTFAAAVASGPLGMLQRISMAASGLAASTVLAGMGIAAVPDRPRAGAPHNSGSTAADDVDESEFEPTAEMPDAA